MYVTQPRFFQCMSHKPEVSNVCHAAKEGRFTPGSAPVERIFEEPAFCESLIFCESLLRILIGIFFLDWHFFFYGEVVKIGYGEGRRNKANSPKSRALNDFENLNNCLMLTES